MGGNQISRPTESEAQSGSKVPLSPSELLMLVIWQDDKVIGRIATTFRELADSNQFGGEGSSNDSKADIRATLRSLYLDSGAQCTKPLDLTSPTNRHGIWVKMLTGKTIYIGCDLMDTVGKVKLLIRGQEGIPTDQQRLIFDYYQLEDDKRLTDYKISYGGLVHLVLRLRGGGGPPYQLPVDLSNPSVHEGKGVRGGKHWECFLKGFNILGRCSSPKNCISKGKQVCVNEGYPKQLILSDSKNVLKCPACREAPMTTRTYLVAACRAKIRFRKASSEQTETLIMESPSDGFHFYTKLLDNQLEKGEQVEYDYVEVSAVKFGMSFNRCQLCSEVMKLSEEKILPCGRAFHKRCLLDNDEYGCPVCQLPEYKLGQLPDLVASRSDKYIRLEVPNHLFGSCSSPPPDSPPDDGPSSGKRAKASVVKSESTHVTGFLRQVISTQFENLSLDDNKIPIIELQENFVLTNLPYLIKHTEVTDKVIEGLRELEVLSEEEEKKVRWGWNEIEKCRQLYKIVPTHPSGIAALMTVLGRAGQRRAVVNLSMFDTMLTTYSKNELSGKTK